MFDRFPVTAVSDAAIAAAAELDRQQTQIELIASENTSPPTFSPRKARC